MYFYEQTQQNKRSRFRKGLAIAPEFKEAIAVGVWCVTLVLNARRT
ncbi:MAG: hypothetical protein J7647_28870 [Cyanobacteria bacterium SBLK]|nr:hypothetical protein [Cyanobacteria bacterium SBLK]